jgi:hypothetical protein
MSGLHEAVGVAIEGRERRLAVDLAQQVLDERLGLEVGDRTRLRRADVRVVADQVDAFRLAGS